MLPAILYPMRRAIVSLDDIEFFIKNQELPEVAGFTFKGKKFFLYAFLRSRPSINIIMDATNHIAVNPRNVVILMQPYYDNVMNVEPYVADINAARKNFIQFARNREVPTFSIKEEAIAYILEKLKSV